MAKTITEWKGRREMHLLQLVDTR